MEKAEVKNKIFIWLCSAVAFSLPFGQKFPSVTTIILVIYWFYLTDFKKLPAQVKKNLFAFLFPILIIYNVFGLLWSNDINNALRELETRIPLFLFPIVLITSYDRWRPNFKFILHVFVLANLFALFICIAQATFHYFQEIHLVNIGELRAAFIGTNFFFASMLSWFLHPSYFSMYLCFSMIVLLVYYYKRELKINFITVLSILLLFSVLLFMLNSKIGIALCVVIWVGYFVYVLKNSRKRLLLSGIATVVLASGIFIGAKSEMVSSRFIYMYEALFTKEIAITSSESNEVRILIWNATGGLLKQNFLYGVGTGDVSDELVKEYAMRGMTGAFEKRLNAHNQFLQSFLECGILALLLLLILLFIPLVISYKKRNLIIFSFYSIVIINFAVESMLQTQAGTLFVGFFAGLLVTNRNEINIE